MKKSIVLFLLLLIIFSCSKKTASTASTKPATQTSDTVATSTPVDMTVAENQFRQTCSSCHKLPDPQKHTAAEWPYTVNKMQHKKNGFDDTRKEQILAYLTANARK